MAIADLSILFSVGVPSITSLTVQSWTGTVEYNFEPDNYSDLTCKLIHFVAHKSLFISFSTLTAYSLERLLSIWNPFFRIQYINLKNAKLICTSISFLGLCLFSPILFANPYKLRNPIAVVYYRYCGLTVQDEPLLVKIWYFIALAIMVPIFGPVGLIATNVALLYKLRILTKKRIGFSEKREQNENREIQAAKDILIISIITLILCLPMLSWVGWLVFEGMF